VRYWHILCLLSFSVAVEVFEAQPLHRTLKKFGSPMPVFAYTTEDSYIPFLVVAWTMWDGGVNAVFARRRTSSSYT
jgi:hypothetical protein